MTHNITPPGGGRCPAAVNNREPGNRQGKTLRHKGLRPLSHARAVLKNASDCRTLQNEVTGSGKKLARSVPGSFMLGRRP